MQDGEIAYIAEDPGLVELGDKLFFVEALTSNLAFTSDPDCDAA
jgi:hypothetical protein